jgi:hypothetical protein
MIADAVVAMALDERDDETGQSISARLRFSLFIDPGQRVHKIADGPADGRFRSE